MDAPSAAIIAAGAGQALYAVFAAPFRTAPPRVKRHVWLHFGGWLRVGSEFEPGADIRKTAISPGWTEIGQLGAIAVIRVFLNYFLQRDMERYAARRWRPT
jgi:uncharacterized membrane protein